MLLAMEYPTREPARSDWLASAAYWRKAARRWPPGESLRAWALKTARERLSWARFDNRVQPRKLPR